MARKKKKVEMTPGERKRAHMAQQLRVIGDKYRVMQTTLATQNLMLIDAQVNGKPLPTLSPVVSKPKPVPMPQKLKAAKAAQEHAQLMANLREEADKSYTPEHRPKETGRKFRVVNGMVEFY